MDEDRDHVLLQRYVAGERDAFAEIVERHEDALFAVAVRLLGDREDALDAVQETFVSALRNAASFRGESSLRTWLVRITLNACHDAGRRRARAPVPEADVPEPPATGNEARVAERAVARVDVAAALARLPEDFRVAVAMHDLAGIPYAEVARATGAEIGTVKSRISRGRARLAEILEPPGEPATSKDRR